MDTHEVHNSPVQQVQQVHTSVEGIVPRGEPIALAEVAVLLHPRDDVAIARVPLNRGVVLKLPAERTGEQETLVEVKQRISSGHKVALRDIAIGAPVRRYGSIIGYATQPIRRGAHVHSHNLAVGALNQVYESVWIMARRGRTRGAGRTFMGYRRPDGKAATRNYIALIGSVNCAASTIRHSRQASAPMPCAPTPMWMA